ncbi:MAG: hypothetical protein A4S09_07195 [Proteobacteria bacterium SG_bin7]|nr:MAG: hypothetical protein A4S09_07195 [Proteobacteria bacterium SG_bin7]
MSVKSLTSQILSAILLGTFVGVVFGAKIAFLGALGTILITLIKTVAVPLIFFAILDSLLTCEIHWHQTKPLFKVVFINTLCAATIGLLLANILNPGAHLQFADIKVSQAAIAKFHAYEGKNIFETIGNIVPDNFIEPFRVNAVISVVLIALFIGVAARRVQKDSAYIARIDSFQNLVSVFLKIFEQILKWIIKIVPLAIFGVIAKTVGEYGFSPLKGLAIYVLVGLLGLTLQVLIVYQSWVVFCARKNLKEFWRTVKEAVVHAWGSNSSLATLPLTLKALEELKVSKASARLGACVATNLNNDGILLYEAMAVLVVAQSLGLELTLLKQLEVAGLSVVAAIGITGVPEAGLISLALVLSTVGLPIELLPIVLTVDWIVGRGRSVVNVLSDIVVSLVVDQEKCNAE